MLIIVSIIGCIAVALLVYYVVILMKGDNQNEHSFTIRSVSCNSCCIGRSTRFYIKRVMEGKKDLSFKNTYTV